MKLLRFSLVVLLCGCSASSDTGLTIEPPEGSTRTIVNGNLTLQLHDFVAQPGVLWALPGVQVTSNSALVQNTRYGSLCHFDVTGAATVTGARLTLDITYSERLTLCTAEIRALTYGAQISGLSGTYDLFVVHHENNHADTLVHRTIDVR